MFDGGFEADGSGERVRPARRRPFTIADAMILVVATAGSLAYLRRTAEGFDNFRRNIVGHSPISGWITAGEWAGTPFLTTWTLALLALRACPPRPPRRRLSRQPGAIACAAAGLSMVASVPFYWPYDRSRWAGFHLAWNHLLGVTGHCGVLVLAAWGVMVYGRTWRPEPGWIDGMGRVLGALWIVAFLANITSNAFRMLDW